jgi:hypothetical protein
MVKFYVDKIKNAVTNPNTGEPWKLGDVPKLWRSKVEKELQE